MAEPRDPLTQPQEDAKFINKLYDTSLNRQKETLAGNFTQNTGALDQEKQNTQKQTQDYQQRTMVEADKGQQNLPTSGLSAGGQQQAALTLDNQRKRDTRVLNDAQAQADAEIERERQLLASEYEAAIKEAQANNDMVRAQKLYEAAKLEEERLRGYRRAAGDALAAKGDYSIVQSLYALTDEQTKALEGMHTPTTAPEGYTTPESMKADEEALLRIRDAAIEAENQKLQTDYDRKRSDLQAQQEARQRQTNQALTDTYVEALKQGKNYNEVQSAYGIGSGTKAQADIAREAGLQGDLTDLRTLQTGYDAKYGRQGTTLLNELLAGRQKAQEKADSDFNTDMQTAYTADKNQLYSDQDAAGQILAKDNNDYSILGKLWGLNQDQIDRLQGTGKYAPAPKTHWKKQGTGASNISLLDAIDAAVATGSSQKSTASNVNKLINAAKADKSITAAAAAALKKQYSGQVY